MRADYYIVPDSDAALTGDNAAGSDYAVRSDLDEGAVEVAIVIDVNLCAEHQPGAVANPECFFATVKIYTAVQKHTFSDLNGVRVLYNYSRIGGKKTGSLHEQPP